MPRRRLLLTGLIVEELPCDDGRKSRVRLREREEGRARIIQRRGEGERKREAATPTQMLDACRDFRWRLRLRGTPSTSLLLHPHETAHHGPDTNTERATLWIQHEAYTHKRADDSQEPVPHSTLPTLLRTHTHTHLIFRKSVDTYVHSFPWDEFACG